jgi:hypothetical protein
MDKSIIITFIVLSLLCLYTNALTCYDCASCNDPFASTAGTVITCNSTQTSCKVRFFLLLNISMIKIIKAFRLNPLESCRHCQSFSNFNYNNHKRMFIIMFCNLCRYFRYWSHNNMLLNR